MKAVLLGGSGFIGTHVAAALKAAGYSVWNCDPRPPRQPADLDGHLSTDAVHADAAQLEELLGGQPVVYHLAWRWLPAESNRYMAPSIEHNVVGALRVLEACVKAGTRRFVYFSSGGTIYGPAQGLPIAETHPTEPLNAHAISKLMVEKYVALFGRLYGLDYVTLRPGNPFGPYQNPNGGQGVIAAFLARAAAGQPLEVWGDGETVRDFFYVGDLARAAVLAAETERSRTIYNIGSGQGRTLLNIIAAIEGMLGRKLEVRWRPGRATDVPANVLDVRKAHQDLGWMPQVSFEDGLQLTWESLSDPDSAVRGEYE